VAEYLFDRLDWLWEWFSGQTRALEKKKKSAVFVLLSEMERHKRLLAEDLMVMRVVSLWLHGPIGHSATEDDTKAHRKALQKLVAEAREMADDGDAGEEKCREVFKRCGAEALVQRDELHAECKAKVAQRNGSAGDDAPNSRERKAQRETAHAGAVSAKLAAMAGPTEHQLQRLKSYAAETVAKHEKFLSMLLAQADDEDITAPLHTFHIERGNAVLKILHDLNVHTSAEFYRAYSRLMAEKGLFASGADMTASAAAFGWLNPPPHMRQWMMDVHRLYCRELTKRGQTRADIREEQNAQRRADEEEEAERATQHAQREREAEQKSRDWDGGMVRTCPCPDIMPAADVAELKTLISGLYDGKEEGYAMPYGEVGRLLRAAPRLRLRELIAAALVDTTSSYDQWAQDFSSADDTEITEEDFIYSLNKKDGTDEDNPHLGWPTACQDCACDVPCAGSRRLLDRRLSS